MASAPNAAAGVKFPARGKCTNARSGHAISWCIQTVVHIKTDVVLFIMWVSVYINAILDPHNFVSISISIYILMLYIRSL